MSPWKIRPLHGCTNFWMTWNSHSKKRSVRQRHGHSNTRNSNSALPRKTRTVLSAQQAQALLKEGKLEEAGALLDHLLGAEEKTVEQVAAHHFNRAEIYTLQFQLDKALLHYEKSLSIPSG